MFISQISLSTDETNFIAGIFVRWKVCYLSLKRLMVLQSDNIKNIPLCDNFIFFKDINHKYVLICSQYCIRNNRSMYLSHSLYIYIQFVHLYIYMWRLVEVATAFNIRYRKMKQKKSTTFWIKRWNSQINTSEQLKPQLLLI